MKPKIGVEAQIEELRLRVDSLERTLRMRSHHRREPVLHNGGQALQRARKVAGWSLRSLGAALSVSGNTLKNWEDNKHPLPQWRVQQIIQVFSNANTVLPRWGDLDDWTDGEDRESES